MATYAQHVHVVLRGVAQAKRVLRKSQSAGEALERELNRLRQRKTLIGPGSLTKSLDLFRRYSADVDTCAKAMADLGSLALSNETV